MTRLEWEDFFPVPDTMMAMSNSSRISADGERRLKDAISEQVRREFAAELAAATEHWAQAAVEKKIEDEVERRMKEVASSHSLWSKS